MRKKKEKKQILLKDKSCQIKRSLNKEYFNHLSLEGNKI